MKDNITTIHKTIVKLAFLLLTIGTLSFLAVAQDHQDHGQEMKAAHTAQEHRSHSEQYQKKADEYRKEAGAHRKMLVDYADKRKRLCATPIEAGRALVVDVGSCAPLRIRRGASAVVLVVPPIVDPDVSGFVSEPTKLLQQCYSELFRVFYQTLKD